MYFTTNKSVGFVTSYIYNSSRTIHPLFHTHVHRLWPGNIRAEHENYDGGRYLFIGLTAAEWFHLQFAYRAWFQGSHLLACTVSFFRLFRLIHWSHSSLDRDGSNKICRAERDTVYNEKNCHCDCTKYKNRSVAYVNYHDKEGRTRNYMF